MSYLKKSEANYARHKTTPESEVKARNPNSGLSTVSEFFAKPLEERPSTRHRKRIDNSRADCSKDSGQALPKNIKHGMTMPLQVKSGNHNVSPAHLGSTSIRQAAMKPLHAHRTNEVGKQIRDVLADSKALESPGFDMATSHVARSITPRKASHKDLSRNQIAASSIGLHRSGRSASFHSRVPEAVQPPVLGLSQDPLSQSSVERFTRNALLSNATETVPQASGGLSRQYFSLADLKDMAKLAELNYSQTLNRGSSPSKGTLKGRQENGEVPRPPYKQLKDDTHLSDFILQQPDYESCPRVLNHVAETTPGLDHECYAATAHSNPTVEGSILAATEPLWRGLGTPRVDCGTTFRDQTLKRFESKVVAHKDQRVAATQSVFPENDIQRMENEHSLGVVDSETQMSIDTLQSDLQDAQQYFNTEGLDSFDTQLLGLDFHMDRAQLRHQQSRLIQVDSTTLQPQSEHRAVQDVPHSRLRDPSLGDLGWKSYATRQGESSGLHRPSLENGDLYTRFEGFSRPHWLH